MNIDYFKEEFMNFLRRFTTPSDDRSTLSINPPLGYQEILGAVTDVINTKFNVAVVNSNEADVRTPAAGIIVTTPDAPDIPKVNIEHEEIGDITARFTETLSNGTKNYYLTTVRFQPSGTLTTDNSRDSSNGHSNILEPRPLTTKYDDDVSNADCSNAQDAEKPTAPKTSPVNTLRRSDTYVRENELDDAANEDFFDADNVLSQFTNNNFGSFDFSVPDFSAPEFRKKLNTLREAAADVVRRIDDIEKVAPDNTRPIRRLSSIGCFPSLNRTSVASRTIQRPKMSRRSLTAFPGTPTSSRMSPSQGKPELPILKGIASSALMNVAGGSRLSIPAAVRSASSGALKVAKNDGASPSQASRLSIVKPSKTLSSTHRSVSSGALKLEKKCCKSPTQASRPSSTRASKTPLARSPALSLLNLANESQGRPPKNPKYAYVQSTIPKNGPVLGKRKAEEF